MCVRACMRALYKKGSTCLQRFLTYSPVARVRELVAISTRHLIKSQFTGFYLVTGKRVGGGNKALER